MQGGDETSTVFLRRDHQGQSWGFRLQGGTDFNNPLSVQIVNPGSPAEAGGLKAGDAVLQINSKPSDELTHDDAKREILMAGDQVQLLVKRGSVTVWRPQVTSLADIAPGAGHVQQPYAGHDGQPMVQRTSLAANKQDSMNIGSSHNVTARGFNMGSAGGQGAGGQGAGGQGAQHLAYGQPKADGSVPAVVHSQYNSPMGLYSNNNVQDTYQFQSNALTGGMTKLEVSESDDKDKKSPTYLAIHGEDEVKQTPKQSTCANPTMLGVPSGESGANNTPLRSVSPTYRLLQEEEGRNSPLEDATSAIYTEQKGEEIQYKGYSNPNKQSRSFRMLEQDLHKSNGSSPSFGGGGQGAPLPGGMRSVRAPTGPPSNVQVQQAEHHTCKVCGALIIGVFVKVKGEPMHAECYKCVKCRKSLKNQGYFTVNGGMYCDVCAQQVAQPTQDGMVAVPQYR